MVRPIEHPTDEELDDLTRGHKMRCLVRWSYDGSTRFMFCPTGVVCVDQGNHSEVRTLYYPNGHVEQRLGRPKGLNDDE